MATLAIREIKLELTTVKLTPKLLKQIPVLEYRDAVSVFKNPGDSVVGWVHGLVLGDEWKKWLVVKTGPGEYGRIEVMESTIKQLKAQQIYLP